MNTESVDVLVIGAGPSGCVSATYLQNNNINVKVIEKSKFPRFVIGESLLPKCMEHFEEVGLLDDLVEKNFEKKYGARFLRDDIVCDFDFSIKHSEGWDWTWQVPRDDFDDTLAKAAQKKGVPIEFESEVLNVKFEGSTSYTTVKDKDGNEKIIEAKFIIDSSGYGRVLPRLLDLDVPSSIPKHSSVFSQVKDINRPEGREGTLITFDVLERELWLWVIPFSNGNTSIGFVGDTALVESIGGSPADVLKTIINRSDYYRDRFKDLDFLFEPKIIRNFSKAVKQLYGDGYALTGNSAEFLDPVFSSGVTFATESGLQAAKLACKQLKGENVDWQKEYTEHIKFGVDVFSTYVKEWYTGNLQTLFFHRPENPDVKKQICSVLAGYVWDETNPFVKKHKNIVRNLAYMVEQQTKA